MSHQLTIVPSTRGKPRTVVPCPNEDSAKRQARGLSHLYCVVVVEEVVKGEVLKQWQYKNGRVYKGTKR